MQAEGTTRAKAETGGEAAHDVALGVVAWPQSLELFLLNQCTNEEIENGPSYP